MGFGMAQCRRWLHGCRTSSCRRAFAPGRDWNGARGGPKSGLDGGNDGGKGITDTPGGIKLQCEGHDVRYRNAWIKELDLTKPDTDFSE